MGEDFTHHLVHILLMFHLTEAQGGYENFKVLELKCLESQFTYYLPTA